MAYALTSVAKASFTLAVVATVADSSAISAACRCGVGGSCSVVSVQPATVSASGGVGAGGSASVVSNSIITSSGGSGVGGSASVAVGSADLLSADGGTGVGGSAIAVSMQNVQADGGSGVGGSASVVSSQLIVANCGAGVGGSAATVTAQLISASGGVGAGGDATVVNAPAGSAYEAAVMALSPLAYFRLDEAAGATSVASKVGGYTGTVDAAATAGIAYGPLIDGTAKSVKSSTTGSITLPNQLATDMLNSPTWTLSYWFKSVSQTAHFSATVSSTKKLSIGASAGTVRATYYNTATGANWSRSQSTNSLQHGWHHVVLTSTGKIWVDNVEYFGTSSYTQVNTVGCRILALSDGTYRNTSYMSEVSIFQSELTTSDVNNLWTLGTAYTAPAGLMWAWNMEQESPQVMPPGSPFLGEYAYSAALSAVNPISGAQSLSAGGGAWRVCNFWNNRSIDLFGRREEGTLKYKVRFSGASGIYLNFQLAGKDPSGLNDTNDGISCRITADRFRFSYAGAGGTAGTILELLTAPVADTDYNITCKWKVGGTPTLSLTVNGTTVTTNDALTAWNATSIHQLQIGNDTIAAPTGLLLDDVEIYGSWQS